MALREVLQEVRELGPAGTLFRASWELRLRTGLMERLEAPPPPFRAAAVPDVRASLPWADPRAVAAAVRGRIPEAAIDALLATARDDAAGRVLAFHHAANPLGSPPDWHLHPGSGLRWDAARHWSRVLADAPRVGDPKQTWEPARFPHACRIARAAALTDVAPLPLYGALLAQVESFLRDNPYARGVHWVSSQECALRVNAWLFAVRVFDGLGVETGGLRALVARHAWEAGHFTEAHLEYAERAVNNNHLITEALGLAVFARLAPDDATFRRWTARALELLDAEAHRQFYPDGAYLNLSHNYHRAVVQEYLLAARWFGWRPAWRAAMERSLDFLVAHQNVADGSLPNHGHNDGSLSRPLSTCDFSDFRPALQCLSVAVRGERIYPPGPWDEEAAWLLGPDALDVPLREPTRRSVSFARTGYHVLRRAEGFAALRCGDVPDRHGQIDMLHLDVWWRGLNVLVDGGTYLYSGERKWLDHFTRTASHNTVAVDGRDQMLHWRQFKFLYPTKARLLAFRDDGRVGLMAGEHTGYARHPGGCVHRRAVLALGEDCVIVIDRVTGEGAHRARLHWLAAPFPHAYDAATATLTLDTPRGPYRVVTLRADGRPLAGDVVAGADDPPRGWLARRYAEKVRAPSLAAECAWEASFTAVSALLGPGVEVSHDGVRWRVRGDGMNVSFAVRDGVPDDVREESET
ncbi:MAG: alginate lyase family protein [Polyangiales bacterium]